MAEALLEHEESIGPHGIPWAEALDAENDGWFTVEERVDYAQAALDRWHEDHKGKQEPGVRLVVVNERPSGPVGDLVQGGHEPREGAGPE